LLVEAFSASDAVQEIGWRDVIVLSTSAHLACTALLGQPARSTSAWPTARAASFSGELSEVAMLGSDGGLARYRLRIVPWIWRLGQVRNSRVWQDKSVIEIVDAVFQAYQPLARWRWSDETSPSWPTPCRAAIAASTARPTSTSSSGCWPRKGWAGASNRTARGRHRPVRRQHPAGAPSRGRQQRAGGAVRFMAQRSVEQSDTVQALVAQRRLHASLDSPCSATTTRPSRRRRQLAHPQPPGQQAARCWNPMTCPGQYAYANREQAQRHADLQMEGRKRARALWQGRSTVRTLRAGTRLTVTGMPLQASAMPRRSRCCG
jgi:type VI secretion system secreted protein VgrG